MPKGRQLLGLPVIAVDSGEVLGQVEELLLDAEHRKLAALVVREGSWLKSPQIIRWPDVLSVGRDAVTVADQSVLEAGSREKAAGEFLEHSVQKYTGLRVVTADGNDVGTLEDVVVELPSGQVSGWELSDGLIQDLLSGRVCLLPQDILSFGKNAVVVSEQVNNLWKVDQGRGTSHEVPGVQWRSNG